MRLLCKELNNKDILRAFLDKSIFNGGEVEFLVVKEEENFHVFHNEYVTKILSEKFIVANSKAKVKGQMDDQKVIFKVADLTYGEIEMRNDSNVHYREVKFWLDKNKILDLLKQNVKNSHKLNDNIILYDTAIKKLKNET
ncbi:MAG TPA: hypothetical protein PLE45_09890 [Spirochaetota bacterium]|nr:hypothetical protein [Spirochaetota bacterium]HOL57431.1 hypothetical protein [Spirochaetota bacterium]HPP04995.1 hypothetical protein [Spirochaetota bacterium]